MKRCIYCPAILSEREELLYGDRCEDHAMQFDQSAQVTGKHLLHDEEPDDDDYDYSDKDGEELNFH